jgi:membrane protein implicated in regulation of membrane protease activity
MIAQDKDPLNREASAQRIQNLGSATMPSSWRIEYTPLLVLFLCLLVFDTNTWLQRILLFFLTLVAAFLLRICLNRVERREQESQQQQTKEGKQLLVEE